MITIRGKQEKNTHRISLRFGVFILYTLPNKAPSINWSRMSDDRSKTQLRFTDERPSK